MTTKNKNNKDVDIKLDFGPDKASVVYSGNVWNFPIIIAAIVISILLLSLISKIWGEEKAKPANEDSHQIRYFIKFDIALLKEPGEDQAVITILPPDAIVEVVVQATVQGISYYYVVLNPKVSGWIRAEAIEWLKSPDLSDFAPEPDNLK